jgi:hypothetical protein
MPPAAGSSTVTTIAAMADDELRAMSDRTTPNSMSAATASSAYAMMLMTQRYVARTPVVSPAV